MQRDVKAVEAFLHGGGIPAAAIAESVVQSETIVTRALEEEDAYDLPRLAGART